MNSGGSKDRKTLTYLSCLFIGKLRVDDLCGII